MEERMEAIKWWNSLSTEEKVNQIENTFNTYKKIDDDDKFDILKFNILCTEFLGPRLPYHADEYELYGILEGIEDGPFEQHFLKPEDMKFHSDWNWIMKVVDAIEEIVFDDDNSYNVTIGSTNYCVIQDARGEVIEISGEYGKTKLNTVVRTLYKFLIWYNKNKK